MVSVMLMVLLASGFVASGRTQRDPFERQWDAIMKAAEKIRYPRDSLWESLQQRYPLSEPFPCSKNDGEVRWRSATKPDSVHKLLPGDIDVIGTIGDSLTAGSGAREFNPIGVTIQHRGISFSGGGQGTWREYLTVPNILKVFNPNLRGYSTGVSDAESSIGGLNVAVAGATDDDAPQQAKAFVHGMLRDKNINFTSDWKMLTIFIGHNDLCSVYCYNKPKHSPEGHKLSLMKTLDYLYLKVPRLYVNLISVIDPTLTVRLKRSGLCQIISRLACACLFYKSDEQSSIEEMSAMALKYQEVEKEVAFSERYRGRKDFTVELQPFFQFTNRPAVRDEREEIMIEALSSNPLWSSDCFHFNQKGFSMCSVLLWNNIMQPVGNKSTAFPNKELTHKDLICPSKESPYLFTKENSKGIIL